MYFYLFPNLRERNSCSNVAGAWLLRHCGWQVWDSGLVSSYTFVQAQALEEGEAG